MADAITTTSISLEGQLQEVVMAMQIAEADATQNPNNTNNVTGTFNTETNTFAGTFNLPVTPSIGAGGVLIFTADEYLSNAS